MTRIELYSLSDPEAIRTVRTRIDVALVHKGWTDRTLASEMGGEWATTSDAHLHAHFHPTKVAVKSIELTFIDKAARALGCSGGFEELLSNDFTKQFLGTVFDGKSRESLIIASRYSEREDEEKTRDNGKIMVYSVSPAPKFLTPRMQNAILDRARPSDTRVRGGGEWVKNLRQRYSLRRQKFMNDGFGKAKFVNLVPSRFFLDILERRDPYARLDVADVVAFLDHLEQECILGREVSFGLVNEERVAPATLAWMKTRDSLITVGAALTLTARKSDQLPLILIDSEKRKDIDEARRRLQSMRSALLFDPDNKSAVEKAFGDFRRHAEQNSMSGRRNLVFDNKCLDA